MPNTAIKVSHLTKVYKLYEKPIDRLKESLHPLKKQYHKDFYALNDVSFEIKKGETVGIIGKNGAGKSTLLKIITGVLTPSSGHVHVNGRIASLLELGAGFNPEYTGIENIYLQGTLMGYSKEEMEVKIDEILAFADIGDFVHQPVKSYSSGMFARLAFAVAINVEPDILIVDEALSVGDANFQLKCLNRMNELRISGVTILFVSHDTYSVKALCNRALFIKNGVMQAYGTSIDVVHLYQLYLDEQSETKNNEIEIIEVSKPITPVKITKVNSLNENNKEIFLSIFDSLEVNIEYDVISDELDEVVFVFNLYRERDNLYVCGATTLMDNIAPIKCKKGKNEFSIIFNELPLLCGKYRLRIAINEKNGLSFMDEVNDALFLIFNDNHESEGLITLNRTWHY